MKSRKIFSKMIAGILSMVLMVSVVPDQVFATKSVDQQITAAAAALTDTQSIIYNTATMYNYSDAFYANGKQTINLIDGLGDYNQDTFDLAYDQYPDNDYWEGIYFSSGKNMSYTHNVEVVADSETQNIFKNFRIGETSSLVGEIKDGVNGLKNGDYETKAWTTWTSGGNSEGYIQFEADDKYYIENINIYFLNTERVNTDDGTFSTYPATISIHNGAQSTAAIKTETLTLTEEENAKDTYTATITLDEPIVTDRFSLSFTYDQNHFVVLTEVELFGKTVTSSSIEKPYALYNTWAGHNPLGGENKKAYIYSGLVKDTLVNGQIQFNVPQAGIFDTSITSNKEVYQNIGIPFIYDSKTGYYTFDAGPQGYGIHFDDLNSNNEIDQNEKADGMRLVLDKPFTANDYEYSYNSEIVGFFPFNAYGGVDTNAVYHFGMNTSIDFAMTENGTITGEKDGEPITFEFAGDDDVWVFIDGQLVLDLGGIHDSVSAKIDFKENAITMWATNPAQGSGDLNNPDIGSTDAGYVTKLGKILNEGTTVGKIAKTREKFAAEGEHTLTIYYLERGRGASNCLIRYNLPKQDSLEVAKNIQLAKNETEAISEEEWKALNEVEFTFRVLDSKNEPVTGSYSLYNSATFEGTYKTDANGYFKIKNNQKARFVGMLDGEYTIEEVATSAELPAAVWKSAEWSGSIATAQMSTLEVKTTANTDESGTDVMSYKVSSYEPREEDVDVLFVLCTNYISRPFVSIAGETVVIDYGLPVKVDIMANDVQSEGRKFVIDNLSTPKYGVVKVLDSNDAVVDANVYTTTEGYYYLEYTPTQYLSDIETLSYTYRVLDSVLDGKENYSYPIGVATIVPATTMYYEENFLKADGTNYIKFSTAKGYTEFSPVGEELDKYQEPGVVGTLSDSTYGSDVAYLNGTTDSNGTSYKADTTDGPAAFQYTFTGTGTAFYARTSAKSGYLRVSMVNSKGTSVFVDGDGKSVTYNYIDTKYAAAKTNYTVELPLYNIPVFNIEDLPYDTYTVTVVVAKPSQWYKDQNELYLDGVRVYDPINMELSDETQEPVYENYDFVYTAYEKDLENDVQVNTLRNYLLDTQVTDPEAEELAWTENSMIMFTDTNGEVITASEYKSNGPKQEVYMTTAQSIRFVLSNWYLDKPIDAKLYLGAKVPEGKTATIKVNGAKYVIKNTTDCYYDITSAITAIESGYNGLCIIEVENGLVSFTNLKCTGFIDFSLAGMEISVGGSGDGDEDITVYSLLRRTVETPGASGSEAPGIEAPEKDVCVIYPDIEHEQWYEEFVQFVHDNNIMTGNKNTGEFNPNGDLLRQQFVMILWNIEGKPVVEDNTVFEVLEDADKTQYYANALRWAYSEGIMTGVGGKYFKGEEPLKRQQLAKMLYEYAEKKGYDVSARADYLYMENADQVADYAKEYMAWAVGTGMITGKGGTNLAPMDTTTRAAVAKIVKIFSDTYAK